ncbi:MAG: thiol-disulfide oxidoreductase DCC family protein [Flammeovirgaceae bacterium]
MSHPVILFDGVCNFCDSTINFVIGQDPKGIFKYASLQSPYGESLLTKFGLDTTDYDSFVMVEGDQYYTKSTAALRIAKQLGGLWPLLYSFIIIPKFIRDGVYSLVARNRYKWFGKKDECMLPSPEVRERFIT